MTDIGSTTRAFGGPARYIQGSGEISNFKYYADKLGEHLCVLIDPVLEQSLIPLIKAQYKGSHPDMDVEIFAGNCSRSEIARVKTAFSETQPPRVIAGIGGGQTLDVAKAAANDLNAPLIIVPTAASNDAPTSSLSVLYTDQGVHDEVIRHKKSADLVLVDTRVILAAPVRLFVAGMGDALATFFEAAANRQSDFPNYVWDGYKRTQLGMAIAELCFNTILEKGVMAKVSAENKACTETFEDVVEANILLSGLGFENTGTAGAHGFCSAFTVFPEARQYFHGELIAFGTLCQLIIENQPPELINKIMQFCAEVELPVTLAEIGIEASRENIDLIARNIKIVQEPFEVTKEMAANAILAADALGQRYKCA